MLGKMTFDKASMNLSYFLYSIKLVVENGGEISRELFTERMGAFGNIPIKNNDGKENRTAYNKSKLPRYFGFLVVYEDKKGKDIIKVTPSGEKVYTLIKENPEARDSKTKYCIDDNKKSAFMECIFANILFHTFGKNNTGAEQSCTDIEPPKVILKAIKQLGSATAEELVFILCSLNEGEISSYSEAIKQIEKNRKIGDFDYGPYMVKWKMENKVSDFKIASVLAHDSIGILNEEKHAKRKTKSFMLTDLARHTIGTKIDKLNIFYEPLQLIVYDTEDENYAFEWVSKTLLGCADESDCVICKLKEDFDQALLESINISRVKPKSNVFLVVRNMNIASISSYFQKFSELLPRERNLESLTNGQSIKRMQLSECSACEIENREIFFPINLNIIGTALFNKDEEVDERMDYMFKQCLIETDIDNSKKESDQLLVEKNGFLTCEWFARKSLKYDDLDIEAKTLYDDFQSNFSVEQLKALSGMELLKKMFYSGDSNKDNLCYYLEFHERYRSLFGSIAGGSAYKFGLFFYNKTNSWTTGSANKTKSLTNEEAILLGESIRDALVGGAKIISKYGAVITVADYENLYNQLRGYMPKYVDAMWVQKYYHMLYPELFPIFYSPVWQKHVLRNLQIVPSEIGFIRMGQIALFVKNCKISNAVFAQIFYDEIGGVKTFARIGTGENGVHFNEWVENNHVAVGWNLIGDLTQFKTDGNLLNREEITLKLAEQYETYDKKTASRKSGEIEKFYNSTVDDTYIVAMNGEKILGIAKLTGEYAFNENLAYGNCKDVEWIKICQNDERLPNRSEGKLTTFHELDDSDNICHLYSLIYQTDTCQVDDNLSCKDIEEGIMEERQPRENQIHPLNFILYGAPGTGKTYATAEYALAILEKRPADLGKKDNSARAELMAKYKAKIKNGQILFTTFHQSYGYEEFIQGLRPDTTSDAMSFKTVNGVFKNIADRAMKDHQNEYVIIIDEINRANISKVFGELITLIEDDKRWGELNELSVKLPSGEEFAVPNNLYIIGTMNSADKSISLIDTALRRRFEFIETIPDYDVIDDEELRGILRKLNKNLVKELDSTDLLIGHAYFINKTMDNLCDVMNHSIIPLLYEYFYDNSNKVKAQIKNAIDDTLYEVVDGSLGRVKLKKIIEE
ncbi:MAG: AAA family ATPase [Bacillota bacterium]